MKVIFNFKHYKGPKNRVTLPTNMVVAYNRARKEKRNNILLNLLGFISLCFVYITLIMHSNPILKGEIWNFICIIGIVYMGISLGLAISWDGPKAVLLFTALNTDGFEEYVNRFIKTTEKMLNPGIGLISLNSLSEVKKVQKELHSAVILNDIKKRCKQLTDMEEIIDFIEANTDDICGFIIKKIN